MCVGSIHIIEEGRGYWECEDPSDQTSNALMSCFCFACCMLFVNIVLFELLQMCLIAFALLTLVTNFKYKWCAARHIYLFKTVIVHACSYIHDIWFVHIFMAMYFWHLFSVFMYLLKIHTYPFDTTVRCVVFICAYFMLVQLLQANKTWCVCCICIACA